MSVQSSGHSLLLRTACLVLLYLLGAKPLLAQPPQPETERLVELYNNRAKRFLVKDYQLNGYFHIGNEGITMYASPKDKEAQKPEFYLSWEELPAFKELLEFADRNYQFEIYKRKGTTPLSPAVLSTIKILKRNHQLLPTSRNKPLSGIRIAIDPGHIAGDMGMAKAEGRFIEMQHKGEKIQLMEGDLTLSTAYLLRDSLEKQGAEVFISRNGPNHGANGLSYQNWKKSKLKLELREKGMNGDQIKHLFSRSPEYKIYRDHFLHKDLETRAEKINYFKPDLTVIIHFNADDKNYGWKKPSQRNFGMVFVPGSFLKYELRLPRDRFDFVRTLISEQVKESAELSALVMRQFEKQLQVPAVLPSEEPLYLQKLAIRLEDGVYARNLRLCRLINTPICYGEPLLQDNEKELHALKNNDLQNGVISKRIVDVANSYYKGILQYFEQEGKLNSYSKEGQEGAK
ncbi:N-acetylmuramoyl-L-alanine amidase [Limibacter armeniacum]|uniref:N-acetylmuramoyl-L-alanine amidase family protein n=1 Tax=Limibacter armeniacum TaxID=466084 RepID=UPI002FE50E69